MTAKSICPCETDVEDPGPSHIATCPFSDPDYCPPGWPPDPVIVRNALLAMLFDPVFDEMYDAYASEEQEP